MTKILYFIGALLVLFIACKGLKQIEVELREKGKTTESLVGLAYGVGLMLLGSYMLYIVFK